MLTPCLGRRDLLAAIHAGLTGRRWVTIVGPPGVGKTLAARHAALAMGGAVWIDLQGFQTLEEVVRECLQDLNCDLAPGDSDVSALRRALDDGNRLLVLDGIEGERVEGLAAFVESIITSTRDTKILCTATEPAGSGSELALDVGPLPIPAPHEPLEGAAVAARCKAPTACRCCSNSSPFRRLGLASTMLFRSTRSRVRWLPPMT